MTIIARKDNQVIEVISGKSRLEAELNAHGQAEVLVNGQVVVVVRKSDGSLVETGPEHDMSCH